MANKVDQIETKIKKANKDFNSNPTKSAKLSDLLDLATGSSELEDRVEKLEISLRKLSEHLGL